MDRQGVRLVQRHFRRIGQFFRKMPFSLFPKIISIGAQVIFLYPLLHQRAHISVLRLALFGLISKIVSVLMLAFAHSSLLAIFSVPPSTFSRFTTAGLRSNFA